MMRPGMLQRSPSGAAGITGGSTAAGRVTTAPATPDPDLEKSRLDLPESFLKHFFFFFPEISPFHMIFCRKNSRTVEHTNLFGQIPTDGASVEFNPTRYSKYMYEHSVFTWKPGKGENHGTF
ncbi:unnamed protein product [Cuscuta epithymum]|uniref:Uncharacterized protein n=1 Tax=Cuscuta epithymum TaxID=186058 RepID=A0AAV0ER15_9ASTE|nr:unnamed protein product [Cuscuta epithymum]